MAFELSVFENVLGRTSPQRRTLMSLQMSGEREDEVTLSAEKIDRLSLNDAVDLCRNLQIDSSACTCLSEVRDLLRDALNTRSTVNTIYTRNSEASAQSQVCDTLEKDLEKQKAMKKDLSEIYEDTCDLFASDTMVDGLREIMVETNINFEERITMNHRRLDSELCPILVSGETSAGKSTLINLLIGDELLPYSVLHKTAAICCLRHSEEKFLVYEVSGKAKELRFEKNVLTESVNDKLDELMEDANVKLINIYWPIPLLKNQMNVMLVDTPGLGENEDLVDILMQFLPNAVAFIYVINSANAGGIERNKILRIIEKQISLERGGENVFDISSTIFVCNKWDQVSDKEHPKVMRFIQSKLKECMAMANKRIDMERQVLRLSGSQALLAMGSKGSFATDFEALLKTVKALVPKCLERKYVQLYSWLRKSVLEHAYKSANTHLRYAWTPVEERRKLQADVEKRLVELSKKCAEVNEEMLVKVNNFCSNLVENLYTYLHSKEVTQRLSTWEEREAPNGRSEKLAELIETIVVEKIRAEIVYWQTNEQDFQSNLRSFKTSCRDMCESLEKDVEAVRLMIEGAGQVVDLPKSRRHEQDGCSDENIFEDLGVGGKVAAVLTTPLWVPALQLGASIKGISCLLIAIVKDAKEALNRIALRMEYEKDRLKFLNEFTNTYLKEIITTEYIRENILRKYYEGYIAVIDHWYKTYIPQQLEINKRFLESIVNEGDTSDQVQNKYKPVQLQLRHLLTRMILFRLKFLEEPTFDEANIHITNAFLSGPNCNVQEVRYSVDHSTCVAVRKAFSSRDTEKLHEAECMLTLDHDNIVRTFGIVTSRITETAFEHCSILMELCQGNADTLFKQDPGNACGKFKDLHSTAGKEALKLFKDVSSGTCSALKYIHEHDYLHGNLKLSKILISCERQPKLTGMGSIRYEIVSSSKTMTGISHFAAEVLSQKSYRWSSDVYSFGIALWEMWFGRHAFPQEELGTLSPIEFASMLTAGYRPEHKDEHVPPGKLWKEMQACLDCEFGKRPNVEKLLSCLNGSF